MPKRTYHPSRTKKKRSCGFRKRATSSSGRLVLKRRRQKGREKLSS